MSEVIGSAAAAGGPLIVADNLVTMDPERPRAEAIAVAAGRIVAVGSREEAAAALPGAALEGGRAVFLIRQEILKRGQEKGSKFALLSRDPFQEWMGQQMSQETLG